MTDRASAAPGAEREGAGAAPDAGLERLLAHRASPERAREIVDGERTLTGRLDHALLRTAVLVVAAVFVAATAVGTLLGVGVAAAVSGLEDLDSEAGGLGLDLVGTLCVALLLWRLGWWRRVGFVGPSHWRDTRLLILPAVIALLAFGIGVADADLSDSARVALALSQPFLTGFWEEGLVRGFLLFALLMAAVRGGGSPVRAVLLSAVVFGLLHAVALVGGQDPGAVLSQVIFATFVGIGFGAVMLRTNALWALVGLHALINLGPALQDSGDSGDDASFQLGAVLFFFPLALYGLYLLRRSARGEGEVSARS